MKNPLFPVEDNPRRVQRAMLRYTLLQSEKKRGNTALSEVVGELFESPENFDVSLFKNFNNRELLDYLVSSHQLYLNKYLPEIEQSIELLVKSNSDDQKVLLLAALFNDYAKHLEEHIASEDKKLFPVVERYLSAKTEEDQSLYFSNLAAFYHSHDDKEQDLNTIHKLIDTLEPMHEQQSILEVLKVRIAWIEKDLLIHSKMEEEVLLPRVMQLV